MGWVIGWAKCVLPQWWLYRGFKYIYHLQNLGTHSKTKSSTHFDLGLCRGTPTAVSKFSFFHISSVMWVRWVPFKIIVSRQYQSVSLGSFTVGKRIHVFSAPRETNLNFWSNLFLICLFNCHSRPNRKTFSWRRSGTQQPPSQPPNQPTNRSQLLKFCRNQTYIRPPFCDKSDQNQTKTS